jgi:hypothetical protein
MPGRLASASASAKFATPNCTDTGINNSAGDALPSIAIDISTPVPPGDKNLVFIIDPLNTLPNDGSDADMWDCDSLHLSSDGSKTLARIVYESLQAQ